MALLRFIFVAVICLGLAIYLGRVVLAGLVSGQVAHTNSSAFCKRKSNPIGYWSLIALFAVLSIGAIAVLSKVTYAFLHG
jgi:hypothetical protein